MESLNPNSPFVIEAFHTLKWSSFRNQHDKHRQHRHESLVTAKQIDGEMYLRGMPHPARDDGLKPTAVTEWEWAFNQAIAIWLAGQMSRSSDDENSPMDDKDMVPAMSRETWLKWIHLDLLPRWMRSSLRPRTSLSIQWRLQRIKFNHCPFRP